MASTAVLRRRVRTSKLNAARRKAQAPEPRRWMAESPFPKTFSAFPSSLEKMRSKPAVADLMSAMVSSVGESIEAGERVTSGAEGVVDELTGREVIWWGG
jgi:hypothetical protein